MTLFEIERRLRARLGGTLPGIEAQRRYAPVPSGGRLRPAPASARNAAALLLLYPLGDRVAVPLTVRAAGLRRHAGQISLPGGAVDEGETLADAALREAFEEINVEPAAVRVLGELTPVHVAVSGFTLHPVVGITDVRPAFVPAPHEVELMLEVTLTDLRDASLVKQGRLVRDGVQIDYPYFDFAGREVWGATAMVLGEFVSLLDDERQAG